MVHTVCYRIEDVQLRTNYADMGRLEISLTFILPEFMINLRFSEAMVDYYLNTMNVLSASSHLVDARHKTECS